MILNKQFRYAFEGFVIKILANALGSSRDEVEKYKNYQCQKCFGQKAKKNPPKSLKFHVNIQNWISYK